MGSLKQYSGLTTKVKAMHSKLISKEEYLKIADFETISEIAEYLKNQGNYDKVLGDADVSSIHRETVEYAIIYSVFNDFDKMYKFANFEQRKYLKLNFIQYEQDLIKRAIRKSNDDYITSEQNRFLEKVYKKYSKINFSEVFKAKDMAEIVKVLEGTIYYDALKQVLDYRNATTFDYELALDLCSFKYIWKKKRMYFKGKDLKTMTDCIGTEMDLLNLLWIYRAKKFFKMTHSEIAALIVPIHFRVKKHHIQKLIETNGMDELIAEIGKTFYGKYLSIDDYKDLGLDKASKKIVTRIYNKYYKLEPYSMAVMSSYLRDKSEEMHRLITIVECVRYDFPTESIVKQII